MSTTAIRTVGVNGVPRNETSESVDVQEDWSVIWKAYNCSQGHKFEIPFECPVDMPVFWECPSCETIAFEA